METDHSAALTIGVHDSLLPRASSDFYSKHSTLMSNLSSLEQRYPSNSYSGQSITSKTMSTQTDPVLCNVREEDNAASFCSNCSSRSPSSPLSNPGEQQGTGTVAEERNNHLSQTPLGNYSRGNLVSSLRHVTTNVTSIPYKETLREYKIVGANSIDSSVATRGCIPPRVDGGQMSHPIKMQNVPGTGGQGEERLPRLPAADDDDDEVSLPSAPGSLRLESPVLGALSSPPPAPPHGQVSMVTDISALPPHHHHHQVAMATRDFEREKPDSRRVSDTQCRITSRDHDLSPSDIDPRAPGSWKVTENAQQTLYHSNQRSSEWSPSSQAFSLSREVNGVSLGRIQKELGDLSLDDVDEIELGLTMNDMCFDGELLNHSD